MTGDAIYVLWYKLSWVLSELSFILYLYRIAFLITDHA